ncbi:MAG: hypothetical protein FJ211_08945 [Ignavibacteria bacterium]|nr:hypothetical protein [Ignavibacteria bacterium]
MKTHVLAFILVLAATAASAQTYYIDWKKPNPVVGKPSVASHKRDGTIRNSNGKPKELYFRYDLTGINEKHTAQLCMTLCWFLFPGEDDPYLRPGQNLTENGTLPIYIDLTTNNAEGNSTLKVTLFDKTDTTDALNFDVQFVISENTSIRDAKDVGLAVGPVPSTDALSIRGDELVHATMIGLYDANGELVRSFGSPQSLATSLPLTGLAAGSYRLVLTLQNGTVVGAPVTVVR